MPAKEGFTKERILRRVQVDDRGCWIWQRYIDRHGYGATGWKGKKMWLAHRAAFDAFKGAIPDGHEIDHLCGTKSCCNPEHLSAVLRADHAKRHSSLYTHCVNGHEYTPQNTLTKANGTKGCRACNLIAVRKYQAKKRASK